MTTRHHPHVQLAFPTVQLSWRRSGRHPAIDAAAIAVCAVMLTIVLAVLMLGLLTTGDRESEGPPPVPRNNEPSPYVVP
jgi:uncharacterized membrane protein YdfJ with MMPL/SSD domain